MKTDTWLIIFTALGAIGTIFAPIIAWRLSKERHEKLSRDRQEKTLASIIAHAPALIKDGEWHGTSILDKGPAEYIGHYSVRAKFTVDQKTIFGEYEYWYDANNPPLPKKHTPPATLNVRGGFNDERFLTIWLQSKDEDKVHFGLMILELSSNKRQFTGIWIAFGFHAEQFISGTVKLDKT